MRPKLVSAAIAAAMTISLLGATSASAATEFGDPCGGTNFSGAPVTYFALTAIGKPVQLLAPVSGVITKWKSTILTPGSFPHSLRILRPNGPKTVQVVAEASGVLNTGANVLDTRLPVQAGDRLALFGTGPMGTAFCEFPGPVDTFGAIFGGAPGQTVEFIEVADEAGIPVAAVIEPDADNDGFGDETQDKCPQSAATSAACPSPPAPVALSTSTQVRKGSVTVVVTTSAAASVSVKGVVKLGKGKKATLNGGTQSLSPGLLGKFRLIFTKKVKEKLKELPPKRSLRLDVTVSGTSASGAVTTKTLKVKLKGQATKLKGKAKP